MTRIPLASVLDQAGNQFGAFLPRLLGALLLLVIGVLLARIIARLLQRALEHTGFDELAERWGVHDTLERVGLPRSLSRVLAQAIRIGLSLVAIFAALSLLGLEFLSQSLNAAILLLPNLLVAAALLLVGVVLSGVARERVDRLTEQMDLPVPFGLFTQATILAIFAIMAASQIAVSSAILLLLVAVVLATVLGSLGLAFGLGGRSLAEGLNAGRVIAGSFEIGQTIEVEGLSGEIIAFEPVATVLRTSQGSMRVPNRLLVTYPVLVHEQRESAAEHEG